MSDELKIERLGGIAGFGMPNAHIKSEGTVSFSALSEADQKKIDHAFGKRKHDDPAGGDMFRYRITRQTPRGERTIEVGEDDVPEALKQSIRDTLD